MSRLAALKSLNGMKVECMSLNPECSKKIDLYVIQGVLIRLTIMMMVC